MLNPLKQAIKQLPGIQKIVVERDRLRSENNQIMTERNQVMTERDQIMTERNHIYAELEALRERDRKQFVPSGHFYSPIPSLEEVQRDEATIFAKPSKQIAGIDLYEAEQLQLIRELVPYYQNIPFQAHKQEGLRYYFENPAYSYSDAIFLHCMIRHLKPQKIIEVGSGFSSCVTLDTNDIYFDSKIKTTFIEPYPELLESLITSKDKYSVNIIKSRLQEVDIQEFQSLQANDILFIDSTHVSKVNSDVNRIFFEILPTLSPGVYIHFHDIFYPFEYPKGWIYEGRAWSEAYLLRTFLQYNHAFRLILMNTFMETFHEAFFQQHMPLCLKNPGGSIWLRKESVS